MTQIISTRNDRGQPKIFPVEMDSASAGLLDSPMSKKPEIQPQEIFLGGWLDLFGIGKTKAGEIAGCTQSYISNISGGRRGDVNALYLLRLSERLGVTVNDFFLPPPSETDPTSFIDISAEAREAVIRRWQQVREQQPTKSARKRTSAKR